MEISNLIVRLLLQNDHLAIQGLGVFGKEFQPAYIHPVSKLASPAQYVLKFEQNQHQADELLISNYAGFNALSIEDAEKDLKLFVENIYNELKSGKKYTLRHIGHLVYKQGNTIVFEQDNLFNFHSPAFGLKSIIAEPIASRVSDNSSAVTSASDKIKEAEIVKEIQKPVDAEKPLTPAKPYESKKREEIVEKDEIFNNSTTSILEELYQEKTISATAAKKSYNWVWYIGSAVVLIFLLAFSYLYKEKIFSLFESKTVEIKKDSIPETANPAQIEEAQIQNQNIDSMITEEENIDNQVVEAEVNPEKYNQNIQKPYLLIAGCFKSETNAQNYVNELIKKGYTAELIGQTSGMNRVCFGSYSTKEEANQMLKEVSSKGFKGAWVQFDPQ